MSGLRRRMPFQELQPLSGQMFKDAAQFDPEAPLDFINFIGFETESAPFDHALTTRSSSAAL